VIQFAPLPFALAGALVATIDTCFLRAQKRETNPSRFITLFAAGGLLSALVINRRVFGSLAQATAGWTRGATPKGPTIHRTEGYGGGELADAVSAIKKRTSEFFHPIGREGIETFQRHLGDINRIPTLKRYARVLKAEQKLVASGLDPILGIQTTSLKLEDLFRLFGPTRGVRLKGWKDFRFRTYRKINLAEDVKLRGLLKELLFNGTSPNPVVSFELTASELAGLIVSDSTPFTLSSRSGFISEEAIHLLLRATRQTKSLQIAFLPGTRSLHGAEYTRFVELLEAKGMRNSTRIIDMKEEGGIGFAGVSQLARKEIITLKAAGQEKAPTEALERRNAVRDAIENWERRLMHPIRLSARRLAEDWTIVAEHRLGQLGTITSREFFGQELPRNAKELGLIFPEKLRRFILKLMDESSISKLT